MNQTSSFAGLIRTYASSFAPLKLPNLRLYLGGQLISLLGTWMQATAQSWVVWELAHTAGALGIVVMLNTLPLFVLAPWAGSIADRYNRRAILLGTQTVAMLLAFTLALLIQSHLVQIWHIYLLSLLLGVVNALDFPAQQAFIGDLSGMGQVRQAITLNIMGLQVARMLGPAIAGLVLKWVGAAAAFWLNGLSFLVVLITLLLVRSHQAQGERKSARGQFRESLEFVRGQPRVIDLLIFATLVTFFGLSLFNILPAVADHVLHGDAQTYGLLLGSSGAGALASTLFLLPLSQAAKRIGRVVGGAALWIGASYLVLAGSTWLPLSMLAIFSVSLGAPLVLTTGLGVLQLLAPHDMRARILSLFTMLTFGMQPVASLLIGFTAQAFGTQTVIAASAALLLAGALVMLFFRSGLRAWELAAPPRAVPAPDLEVAALE
jgi:MFS family permease